MQMLFQLEHQANIVNSLLNVRPPKASNISNEDLKVRQSEKRLPCCLELHRNWNSCHFFFIPLKREVFFFFFFQDF